MADIQIVDPETNEPKKEGPPKEFKSENTVTSPVLPELQIRAVEEVMGLDNDSEKYTYKNKVQTLLDWAKEQTKDHSPENLRWVLRNFEAKLGSPPLTEKRVNYLARYAYLELEETKIKKEKEFFLQASQKPMDKRGL